MQLQRVCHDTLDFIQVPGFPSAIETRSLPTLTRSYPRRFTFYVAWPAAPFATLTHSRRIVFNDAPWIISFSLDVFRAHCRLHLPACHVCRVRYDSPSGTFASRHRG